VQIAALIRHPTLEPYLQPITPVCIKDNFIATAPLPT